MVYGWRNRTGQRNKWFLCSHTSLMFVMLYEQIYHRWQLVELGTGLPSMVGRVHYCPFSLVWYLPRLCLWWQSTSAFCSTCFACVGQTCFSLFRTPTWCHYHCISFGNCRKCPHRMRSSQMSNGDRSRWMPLKVYGTPWITVQDL